jgi:hypothetical protein
MWKLKDKRYFRSRVLDASCSRLGKWLFKLLIDWDMASFARKNEYWLHIGIIAMKN